MPRKKEPVDWVRCKSPEGDEKRMLIWCSRCGGKLVINLPMSIDGVAKISKEMVNEHRNCKEKPDG